MNNEIEILKVAIIRWKTHTNPPDRLMAIIQAMALRAACGFYTFPQKLEIDEVMDNFFQKIE